MHLRATFQPPWITLISSDQTVAAASARLRNETRSNPMPLTTTELKKLLQQLGCRFFPKASPMGSRLVYFATGGAIRTRRHGGRMGNRGEIAWGELRWEGSHTVESRAVGTGFHKFHQCDCPEKLRAQDFSSGLPTLGEATCIAALAGSDTKKCTAVGTGFSGQISSLPLSRKTLRPRPAKVSKPWAMGHA